MAANKHIHERIRQPYTLHSHIPCVRSESERERERGEGGVLFRADWIRHRERDYCRTLLLAFFLILILFIFFSLLRFFHSYSVWRLLDSIVYITSFAISTDMSNAVRYTFMSMRPKHARPQSHIRILLLIRTRTELAKRRAGEWERGGGRGVCGSDMKTISKRWKSKTWTHKKYNQTPTHKQRITRPQTTKQHRTRTKK